MILLYKPFGLTPLQAIERLRIKHPKLSDKKLSYAGRLDPMAEGLLLILVDEENKKRRELEHVDKEYEFEALIGISTDSYDLLGIPRIGDTKKVDIDKVYEFINLNLGEIVQQYPPYSSIKVEGKPLYWWARMGKKVKAPKKTIKVSRLELVQDSFVASKSLENIVYSKINMIDGDFRQEEILDKWKDLLLNSQENFQVLKFDFACSSGGYVRSLVHELGRFLGSGAVVFSIKRTRIGVDKTLPVVYL